MEKETEITVQLQVKYSDRGWIKIGKEYISIKKLLSEADKSAMGPEAYEIIREDRFRITTKTKIVTTEIESQETISKMYNELKKAKAKRNLKNK
jgi:hypothetical protein